MKGSKIGCIRRAVVNTQGDFNEWLDKSNMRETSIVDIAEHILNNGCDSKDFNNKIKSYFIEHVEWYTLILLPVIEEVVNNSNHDFIKDDWNMIFTDLFPNTREYDDVVYSVNKFTDTDGYSDNEFTLYKGYDKANQNFKIRVEELKGELADEEYIFDKHGDIQVDSDTEFRYYSSGTNDFYQIKIEKVPLN